VLITVRRVFSEIGGAMLARDQRRVVLPGDQRNSVVQRSEESTVVLPGDQRNSVVQRSEESSAAWRSEEECCLEIREEQHCQEIRGTLLSKDLTDGYCIGFGG
jgi:hypothetical protein